jgi:GNAT superfamily N-acetyltransferase
MSQISIEIIDDERLEERVATEPENADLFGDGSPDSERLHWLTRPTFGLAAILHGHPKGKRNIVLSLGRRIVAVAGVELDSRDNRRLSVTHVSVEVVHRGKGYGRAVVEAVYDHAVKLGKVVDPSTFTEMGEQRIAKIFAELDVKHSYAARASLESDE